MATSPSEPPAVSPEVIAMAVALAVAMAERDAPGPGRDRPRSPDDRAWRWQGWD